jgi:hypothetical protein
MPGILPLNEMVNPAIPGILPANKTVNPAIPGILPANKTVNPAIPGILPANKTVNPAMPGILPANKTAQPATSGGSSIVETVHRGTSGILLRTGWRKGVRAFQGGPRGSTSAPSAGRTQHPFGRFGATSFSWKPSRSSPGLASAPEEPLSRKLAPQPKFTAP